MDGFGRDFDVESIHLGDCLNSGMREREERKINLNSLLQQLGCLKSIHAWFS